MNVFQIVEARSLASLRPAVGKESSTSVWILKNPLFSSDGIYFDFVKVQTRHVCCTARDDMVILFPPKCPMSLVPSFFLMAALPHEAVREDCFQRQVLIFNSAFESTADTQALHVTSQTQCVQLHPYFHAPAERWNP